LPNEKRVPCGID